MTCFILDEKIIFVDLSLFYLNFIERKFLSNCHDYGLIRKSGISIYNKDVEKIFLHNLIYSICEYIGKNDKHCSLIFSLTNYTDKFVASETKDYIEIGKFQLLLKRSVRHISRILPIHIIETNDINTLCQGIIKENGDFLDILHDIKKDIRKKSISKYSLSKAKKFTEKYKLNFLNKEYFNMLYNKMNLCIK